MEKLLAIASLAQRTYSRLLFQKLIPGIIMVAGLIIVTAIMISAVLIGALVLAYVALLHYGIEPQLAVVIVGISSIVIVVILIIAVLSCLNHLRQMPASLLRQSTSTSLAMDLLDSFLEGLIKD